eukprot:7405754-Pyramimonas_sp.AAC.1
MNPHFRKQNAHHLLSIALGSTIPYLGHAVPPAALIYAFHKCLVTEQQVLRISYGYAWNFDNLALKNSRITNPILVIA